MLFNRFSACVRCLMILGFLGIVSISASAQEPNSASDQAKEQESLDVRYARAHLKLANLDWLRFLETQKEFPGVLSAEAGDDLRRHALIDEEQLKQALEGPAGDIHQIYMRTAKLAVELAKRELQRTKEAAAEFPSKETEFAVKRAEAAQELAQLQLQITMQKRAAMSSMMYLQWQIEMLRNQVLELQVKLKSESRRN